jgi:hypothetical protein
MAVDTEALGVAHVIQLAVTPVFLLTGIAGLLMVLTNRLARAVDRARAVEAVYLAAAAAKRREMEGEVRTLSRRARYIGAAIALAVVCAMLVCADIAALFVGAFFDLDLTVAIGAVFIAAMLTLTAGLAFFLAEVYLATRALRLGLPSSGEEPGRRPG